MKTYIITGANSGLGFETAKRIAKKGYRVILACRNMEKGSAGADAIKSETGNGNIESRQLDLASLVSVRNFAEGLKDIAIYALDNNAGISGMKTGTTEDGYDIVFQSNHLGHFLLTNLLLPQIEDDGRILNISSDMHNPPYGECLPVKWTASCGSAQTTRRMSTKICRQIPMCSLRCPVPNTLGYG